MTDPEAKAEAIRRSHARWERTRARGRQRYTLVHGVLLWGGLMTLSIGLGQFIAGQLQSIAILFIMVISSIGGYVVGLARWRHNENVYLNRRDEEIA